MLPVQKFYRKILIILFDSEKNHQILKIRILQIIFEPEFYDFMDILYAKLGTKTHILVYWNTPGHSDQPKSCSGQLCNRQ